MSLHCGSETTRPPHTQLCILYNWASQMCIWYNWSSQLCIWYNWASQLCIWCNSIGFPYRCVCDNYGMPYSCTAVHMHYTDTLKYCAAATDNYGMPYSSARALQWHLEVLCSSHWQLWTATQQYTCTTMTPWSTVQQPLTIMDCHTAVHVHYNDTLKYCAAATHCSWGKRHASDTRFSASLNSLSEKKKKKKEIM
jgi:hypothetical protein